MLLYIVNMDLRMIVKCKTIEFYKCAKKSVIILINHWNLVIHLTALVLLYSGIILTCSPSGWWQCWLLPSGLCSLAAVEWSGFPAAPSSAETTEQQEKQQQDSVYAQLWQEHSRVYVPSHYYHCIMDVCYDCIDNEIWHRKIMFALL